MVVVKPKKGESADSLIARFRKATMDLVREAKERKHHIPESEKKKKKKERLKYWDEQKRQRNE